jgi:hypothetical protein
MAVLSLQEWGASSRTTASIAGVGGSTCIGAVEHATSSTPSTTGAKVYNDDRVNFSDMP